MPGSIVIDPASHAPQLHVFAFGEDQPFLERPDATLDTVRELLGKHHVVWLNVDGLGNAALIEEIGKLFGFHRLALEDVVNTHQRAKVDDYGDHLFIVARMVHGGERIVSEQLSLFVGPNYVVTFQDIPGDSLEPVRGRLRQAIGRAREMPPDMLAYALIDATIDGYYPVIEQLSDRLEALEEAMLACADESQLAPLRALKQDLLAVRRAIWPHREMLGQLIRETHRQISAETRVYLRDCYDHAVQLIDLIEVYRELSMDLRDFYMSSISNRINETMRVLTIVSTVFIPLTFVAGVYGMNFRTDVSPWNMPELRWYYGYPFSLLLMAAIAVLMVWFFQRQGWIRFRQMLEKPAPPQDSCE